MSQKPNDGRIEITIDGRESYLEPSLEACMEIAGQPQGINGVVALCRALHFPTICLVIGAGVRPNGKPLSDHLRKKELPKSVYEAGLFKMSVKAIEFCEVVANGGRLPEVEDKQEEDGDESPLGSPSRNSTADSTVGEPVG